ncbi:MAG: hypothetical protein KGV59_05415 [Tenacibaculum sp.]|nr:hypothetical protein [Tenacibaculum sp.]
MKEKFDIVFNRLKEVKIDENILCKEFWLKVYRLHKNFNEEECWKLMFDNIQWLLKAKSVFDIPVDIMTSKELQEWFTEEELNKHNIYSKGKHELSNVQCVGLANVELEVSGHSEVILFDNAKAEVYDTSFVKGYDNCYFEVNDCIGNAFENCSARAFGTSIIENFGNGNIEKSNMSLVVNG